MQVNGINCKKPSFGMAYKITEGAQDVIKPIIEKSNHKLLNMMALKDTFEALPDTLELTSAKEGGKFFEKLSRKIVMSMKREDVGDIVTKKIRASKLAQNPSKYIKDLNGKIVSDIYDEARGNVVGKLAEQALNIVE